MIQRRRVLLTGATGHMGKEALKQLCADSSIEAIRVLALASSKDKKILSKFLKDERLSVVWGDLRNQQDVQKAVVDMDIILHLGALVSPAADKYPQKAWEINFGGTKNIVDAIVQGPNPDAVKLVYIGTIAETGNRAVPVHWGRVGDPILPSVYDHYAQSKIVAERYVIESGLKYWVSLRQTGILHHELLQVNDGIAYHQPLNNHLEWVTAHDSGRLLKNICTNDLDETFWRKVYNIGGGPDCRLTAYQFLDKVYRMLGVDFRRLEEPNWYALRNFHGHWYLDSDILNDWLDFRSESVDDFLVQLKQKLPFSMRLLRFLPPFLVKKFFLKPLVQSENAPLYWFNKEIEGKIRAFFGSREKWEAISEWAQFEHQIDPPHIRLNHGYDESKTDENISLPDIQEAAVFRGGQCLSTEMIPGDLWTALRWTCGLGHVFNASPYLILKTGHWCEICTQPPWNYDAVARSNPFVAQVWHVDHDPVEDFVYA